MARDGRIWKDVLAYVGKLDRFTAGDLVKGSNLEYTGAAQVLRRLKDWGYIRQVGFAPAEKRNPKRTSEGGRQRKVYEVTERGRKKIAYEKPGKKK